MAMSWLPAAVCHAYWAAYVFNAFKCAIIMSPAASATRMQQVNGKDTN